MAEPELAALGPETAAPENITQWVVKLWTAVFSTAVHSGTNRFIKKNKRTQLLFGSGGLKLFTSCTGKWEMALMQRSEAIRMFWEKTQSTRW